MSIPILQPAYDDIHRPLSTRPLLIIRAILLHEVEHEHERTPLVPQPALPAAPAPLEQKLFEDVHLGFEVLDGAVCFEA